MAIEYEHKYLLKGKPKFLFPDDEITSPFMLRLFGIHHIEQFYMSVDRERNYVHRARCTYSVPSVKLYEECHKIGKGKNTEEIEYYIIDSVYNQLKQFCIIGNVISKTRYIIKDSAGLRWDVDEYSTGEWVAELENPPDEYEVPFEDTINVTESFEYKNISIALNGFPDVQR